MRMRKKSKGSVWLNHKSTALGLDIPIHYFMVCKHVCVRLATIALSYARAELLTVCFFKSLLIVNLSN